MVFAILFSQISSSFLNLDPTLGLFLKRGGKSSTNFKLNLRVLVLNFRTTDKLRKYLDFVKICNCLFGLIRAKSEILHVDVVQDFDIHNIV